MSGNGMHQRTVNLQLPKSVSMDIEFENLTYTVAVKKGKKNVLNSISGKFKSGELTAILGPSGAGKSTLMNILTGFEKSNISGTVKCTRKEDKFGKVNLKYKKDSTYIMQDDRLCPLFTVQEIMQIAADLKLGHSITQQAKEFLICDILEQLSLSNTVDTKCGTLSGGQRKRLSIALELVDNPPVMFLDEPTTGLDSSSSLQCIKMLKALAEGGRTIICTIHQPSAMIFELFNQIYVLAEGQCVYQGLPENAVTFFSAIGLHCPKYHNPADYILEVANGEFGRFTEILAKVCTESTYTSIETAIICDNPRKNSEYNSNSAMVLIQPPSEWYRFRILLRRSLLQLYRDWTGTQMKLVLNILVGIFVGLLYRNYGEDGSKTIRNVGYFLVCVVYTSYTAMMPAVLKFPSEVSVLRKENFNNWYKLQTYYISTIIIGVPLQAIFSISYTISSYIITGQLMEPYRFGMFIIIMLLVTIAAESLGLLIGTVLKPINGTFIGSVIIACLLLLGGFLILFPHMSKAMYYLSYLSFMAYGMEGLVQAMYSYGRAQLVCPDDIVYCHYKSPASLLKELGMDKDNYTYDVTFLIICIVLTKAIAFCTLKHTLSKAL